MKVLIIGQGGREHALAWKIAQSPQVSKVFVAPGNAGTNQEYKTENVAIKAENINELLNFAQQQKIGLTIVGSEIPLVEGIANLFRKHNLNILGPSQQAAQIEGSKAFCKKILVEAGIPTARYQEFTDIQAATQYIHNNKPPFVIKADGLAAGKGVCIIYNQNEAESVIKKYLSGHAFGEAGKKIIIEELLAGQEASFIALISNNKIIPFVSSQDHKARDNQDLGPNTGGMGAYSPAPIVTNDLNQTIIDQVITPTIATLAKNNIEYNGFLYAGLIIDENNNFNVLEFNCRLGDPEAQVILPRLESDFFALCYSAATNNLNSEPLKWSEQSAITVVLASRDYPNTPTTDEIIIGLESIEEKYSLIANTSLTSDNATKNNITSPSAYSAKDFCKVFHAATVHDEQQNIKTNGGRVLSVTALASSLEQAHYLAYGNIKNIFWPSLFYRTDIGSKGL